MKKNVLDARSFNKLLFALLAVIIVLTLAVSVYLGITLNNLSKQVSNNKYLAENNSRQIQVLAKLDDDYGNFSMEANEIEHYLPNNKEVSDLLKDLETMASKEDLNFSSYQAGNGQNQPVSLKGSTQDLQVKKVNGYMVFPFQITLKGSFARVDNMIKQIESYNRLVEIQSVKYTKDQTNVLGDAIKANLTINAYLK